MKQQKPVVLIIILLVFCFPAYSPGAVGEGPVSSTHFYFVQITDTHWGDRDNLERTKTIVEMINDLPMPIACVVHTGDISNRSIEDESLVSEGKKILQKLKMPVHFIPGNKDILWYRYKETQTAFQKHFGELVSEKEYHGVVFLMVCTEPLERGMTVKGFDPLLETKAALDRAGDKPVIVFHHRPSVRDFYRNSMHRGWSDEIRNRWKPLLNAYNVKAILTGHFHRDEHHWVGDVPLYVSPPVSGKRGRQATFRIYEYTDGKIGYRTQYVE